MTQKKKPEYLQENDDGSVTVTFRTGVVINGTKVTAMQMREPTVNDQIVAAKTVENSAEREVAIFANLTMQAPEDIRALTVRDYTRLQTAYETFLD